MYDKSFKGRVTVEETLQILYLRYGRANLDKEITAIFGENDKNEEGTEKEITFGEYVDKLNKRALKEWDTRCKKKRLGTLGGDDEEN